jgi:type II secretory pathway pseudopilin PulG
MAALLVGLSIMAVALSVALPAWNTAARREKEAELIFRGEQYARAIALFQRQYGNALPPSIDVLVNERFLRKRYTDPITGDDFELVRPGTALPGLPAATEQQGRRAGGLPPFSLAGQQTGAGGGFGESGRGSAITSGQSALAQAAARATQGTVGATPGILGVTSKSTERSLRQYKGRERYNEWVFLATDLSRTPGGVPGAAVPGLPGAQPGVRGRGAGTLPGGRGLTGPTRFGGAVLPPSGGQGTQPQR